VRYPGVLGFFQNAGVGAEGNNSRILIECVQVWGVGLVVLNVPGVHQNSGLGDGRGHFVEVVVDVVDDDKNLGP